MTITREQYMREQEQPRKERVISHRETHGVRDTGPIWGEKL